MKKNTELKELFSKIAAQDASAFSKLYNDYYKCVFAIAMTIVKNYDAAQDVAQNVFLKLYTLEKKNFPVSSEMSWLYTVVKNEALLFLRKTEKETSIENFPEIQSPDLFQDILAQDSYNALLKKLSPELQEIVTLKVLGGLTHKEIAALLHLPAGTVQWKYNVAIHKLKIAFGNLLAATGILLGKVASTNHSDSEITIVSNNVWNAYSTILIAVTGFACIFFFTWELFTRKFSNFFDPK